MKKTQEDITRYGVSNATARNWEKLGTQSSGRLVSRANKRKSDKRILPLEYFENKDNLFRVQHVLEYIEKSGIAVPSAILSLGVRLLKATGLYGKPHVTAALNDFSDIPVSTELEQIDLPDDEFDILGLVYQACLREGQKNIAGSYYTPRKIVRNMVAGFDFSGGKTFLDPCCGSGAFLLCVPVEHPSMLCGIDNDRIAVLIARINLLLKYRKIEFVPRVYCLDYLAGAPDRVHPVFGEMFNFIATNPPWGAMDDRRIQDFFGVITSKETFSCFFVKAYGQLMSGGTIRFLFPKSILNVKAHKDIRKFLLDSGGLAGITVYDDAFSGVTTQYVDIECRKGLCTKHFTLRADGRTSEIDFGSVYETGNLVFNLLSAEELSIIRAVREKGRYSLRDSIWALGIVTGDNKRKLSPVRLPGMERIYTGKDIRPFVLKPAGNYILFDRKNLQQVAKDEIYRAPEKLVYKFISDKLVFAYDDTGSLFLNSANILIPAVPSMSIKTVLAFLNSELFRFLYRRLFGEVKILKGNLMELPFPEITKEEDEIFFSLVDAIRNGDDSKREELDNRVFTVFGLTGKQISFIRRSINARND